MKRFFWTKSPAGKVAHMSPAPAKRKNPVEGDLTYCGRVVTTAWRNLCVIFKGARGHGGLRGPYPPCDQCVLHMPAAINIARVRG
ncbi:MAG TPA: hypothetical protein VIJ38_13625 [Acidobacteriaceae bacterium]